MPTVVPLPLETPELTIESANASLIRRSVLPSGLRILSEHVPGVASATIGFWVPVGSRDEQPSTYGSTHFLEHLLFKGTPSRSAFDIAVSFDAVGGEHNALTAKEYTCYYAKVRDRDLPMAVDVIADMVIASVLDPAEFESEREVILEELAMADDDPGDVAGERLSALIHGSHALGRPIGGTKQTIGAVTRDEVMTHYRANYTQRDIVVTVAGAVDHEALVELVVAATERYGWSRDEVGTPRPRRTTDPIEVVGGGIDVVSRDLEQVNLMIGVSGLVANDARRSQLAVMNSILGGGMSSRLFQEVRERRGLAYAVYSFASSYADAGIFGMYAGCAPRKTEQVATLMLGELERLATGGASDTELARAKGQLAGASALALEDSDARMSRLGRSELTLGEFADLESTLARVDAVTAREVQELAVELHARTRSIAAVGNVDASVFAGLAPARSVIDPAAA